MAETIKQLVDGLAGRRDYFGDICDHLDAHLARGDTAYLEEFALALHTRYGSGWVDAELHFLFNRIRWDVTTTPGRANVERALSLGLGAWERGGRPERVAAAVLAQYQPLAALGPVFVADPGARRTRRVREELRACLVHELVLRGAPVARLREAVAWAEASPHWADHPLAWLPWTLAPFEGEPAVPKFFRGGMAGGVGYGLPEGEPLAGSGASAAVPVEIGEDAPDLTAAVRRWARRHNGRIEAAVFLADAELAPDALPGTLAELPLDCLDGLRMRPVVVPTAATEVWQRLFAAASVGGGHPNEFWHGAYGRLAAWRSMAALAGADPDASPEEVIRRVEDCTWYGFRVSTDWWVEDFMDFGVLALGPGRRRLAVLAATDYNGG
ncbi:DUF6183 family protein [Streptomyces sp. Y1]|uniref:DUF6183 family protein n=1 Tax=Streptomyces sp. Y1 TaxID=3238634 RepID=A0AB39TWA6_9ACTN